MKKVIIVLLLIAMVFSLSSCGVATNLIASLIYSAGNGFEVDYEAADKAFTFEDLTITLTESFRENNIGLDYMEYSSASGTLVWVDKYGYNEMDIDKDITLVEYAEDYKLQLTEDFTINEISDVIIEDGLTYITYSSTVIFNYFDFIAFYANSDAIYVVDFCVELSERETYEPYIKNWARSVRLGYGGTAI